ncbi:MAG: hypothetical protein KJZ47_12050, partial [Gemmatimonadales bacterium]|nr:hypothetical protein [Gemmatimonadales bacterium]
MSVGAMVLACTVLMTRLVRVIGRTGHAVLVPVFPGRDPAGVRRSSRAGFVMDSAIPHPAHDRFDRGTQEKGGEGEHRVDAAGTGATGQHPRILAAKGGERQPWSPLTGHPEAQGGRDGHVTATQ